MIRGWVETRVNSMRNRLNKSVGRSWLIAQLRAGWVEFLYILAIVIMSAGIVNAIIQPVNPGYVIFPSTGGQSVTETIIDAFVLLFGTLGIYLSYLSGRQTTKTRMANFFLVIGVLLVAAAIYIGIYVLTQK